MAGMVSSAGDLPMACCRRVVVCLQYKLFQSFDSNTKCTVFASVRLLPTWGSR